MGRPKSDRPCVAEDAREEPTMKLKLILTTAIVGTALALPGVSSAAPPAPTLQDSVVLTGAPAETSFPYGDPPRGRMGGYGIFELHATSGPNGENPSGLVRFSNHVPVFGGPVTCLNVSGDSAGITFRNDPYIFEPPLNTSPQYEGVTVIDGQPDMFFWSGQSDTPIDCQGLPFPDPSWEALDQRLEPPGDITVVDCAGADDAGPVPRQRLGAVRLEEPGAVHRLRQRKLE